MVRQATATDLASVVRLALSLWPDHSEAAFRDEFRELLTQREVAVFLLWKDGQAVGFAQCQLRHDYVEGTGSSPVGYLEGVYVDPAFRRQSGAQKLLAACENWARTMGCREFASDCELDNHDSLAFHLHAGFQEANRIICFTKAL